MTDAVMFGHRHIVRIIDLIEELRDKAGLGTKEAPPAAAPNPLAAEFDKHVEDLKARKLTKMKLDRYADVARTFIARLNVRPWSSETIR